MLHFPIDRRKFLLAGGLGFFGTDLASIAAWGNTPGSNNARAVQSGAAAVSGGKARSTIMIWLSGGASHIDTWDMKPRAPLEYRGPFSQIETSAPGVQLCEHLPLLARQAHHLAIVRSVGDMGRGTGDHHAGYYYNLTGHAPDNSFHRLLNARTPYEDDWPSMASVVALKRPPHPHLPQAITLPQKEGAPMYTRPGQFGARLGFEYDPMFVDGSREKPLEFSVPALQLQGEITRERLLSRQGLLAEIDQARSALDGIALDSSLRTGGQGNFRTHQDKAFSLLSASQTQSAFDLLSEPAAIREKYGSSITAMSFLLARRLVEAHVPWITIFWKEDKELDSLCKSGGGWDTHGNNFNCLKDRLLPQFDRPFAALLDDLHTRGLLDETLVIVSSEMGRKPKIGDPRSGGVGGAGRDHWTRSMSILLAGGGIQGGQAYGTSDARAEFPADRPVAPEDIAKTVFHAMGINDLSAADRQGRPYSLMDEGEVLTDLF